MSADQKPESIALFYTEGSSDKEYRVELRDVGNGQWMTLAFNGRRGSTLTEQKKTQTPVDFDTAKKEYDKVVKSKLKGGYTPDQSGAVYQSTDMSDRFSGFVPQLLNSVRKPSEVELLIIDAKQVAQEKHDGERRPIRRQGGGTVQGINKEGLVVGLPVTLVADIESLGIDVLVDGEVMGERYVAFDLLEADGTDLRSLSYDERLGRLTGMMAGKAFNGMELIFTARTSAQKRKLLEDLRSHRGEGVVFKDSGAHYAPGRPASGGSQHKYKFLETCSVRVASQNTKKRSVAVEAVNAAGDIVPLGNVTIPPNFDVPAPGAIVNVEYLYLYDKGSLFQTTYKGERTDQTQPDELSKFKLKSTTAYKVDADENEEEAVDVEAVAPKAKKKAKL